MHWKGVSPVDGWRSEFCPYSAQPRNWFQEFWWPWQKVRRKRPTSWIFLSICPLDWGWYPDERLMVTPRSEKKALHILEINRGPQSETMSEYLKILLNMISAVSIAVGRPLRERRRQDLENRSITTRTHVLPSEAGRSVMKSTPRCNQGRLRTGGGRSLPDGRWQGLLAMDSLGRTFSHP